MTRDQNFQYEMFVRVRDYGIAERDLFPESSTGGLAFARVTAAVSAIDEHLKDRVLAGQAARRVKAATRAAVSGYMKAFAQAGRRVTRQEPGRSPFRMPRRRSLAVELSAARALIEEARKRQDQFIQLGLLPAFISDFQALVDRLQQAVDARVSAQTRRRQARTGLETELAQGLDVIRDLDVVVLMATREDPIRFATYQTARRIEGQRSSGARRREAAGRDGRAARGAGDHDGERGARSATRGCAREGVMRRRRETEY